MQWNELLSPGMCLVCESGTQGLDFFDSNYNLELDTMVYLSGRKYVCEVCFGQMAEYFGYESSDQIRYAEEVKEDLQAEVKALYDRLESALSDASTTWNRVAATPVKVRGKPGRPRKHPVASMKSDPASVALGLDDAS